MITMPARSQPLPACGLTREEIAAWARESRRKQGLPDKIEDPVITAKVRALLTARGWPPPWAARPGDLDADEAA